MTEYKLSRDTDRLIGGDQDDVFLAGSINDLRGADILRGGAGTDTLRFSGITTGLALDYTRLAGLSSVERIDIASVSGAITMALDAASIGQADNGSLTVAFGANAMMFGVTAMDAGDTMVLAGTGQVTLRNFADQKIRVADGFDGRITGGAGDDTLTGGTGNDTLKGGVGRDTLTGGAGDDVLDGGAGVDLIVSGGGRDTVTGGSEADTFKVGPGTTTITDFAVDFHLERIDLRGVSAATDFAKLAITDTPAGASITVADTTILLSGVKASQVSAGNFIYSGQTDTSIVYVDAGTSQDVIQRLLDEAPPGTTIQLAAGTYEFDTTLRIDRSDISLLGAGSDKTIIRSLIPDAQAGSTIKVQGALADHRFADVAVTAVKGSKTVQLTSTKDLKVGDVVYIAQSNDAKFFAETGNTGVILPDPSNPNGSPLREMLSKVVAIDGNKVTLAEPLPYTFEAGKGWAGEPALLKNVEVGGFKIETAFTPANSLNFENTRSAWLGVSTVSFRGVADSKLFDVGAYNNASTAFAFTRTYGLDVDSLTAVGSQNKGEGGSGYAWSLAETFAGNFTHLTDKDMRHSVLFSAWDAEHYNNIQVDFTNRDINFHGSPDSGNTVTVDRSVAYYEVDRAAWPSVGPGAFPVHPHSTIEANDVRFLYLRAGRKDDVVHAAKSGGDIDTAGGHDTIYGDIGADRLSGGDGNDMIWGAGGNDSLFGGRGRDTLRGGAGDDTLTGDDGADFLDGEAGIDVLSGGAASDLLRLGAGDTGTGGAGTDSFVILGNATITDFNATDRMEKIDLRGIAGATGMSALKIAAVGKDTAVTVGGVTITLKNIAPRSLTADSFVFVGDKTATLAEMHTRLPTVTPESGIETYVGSAINDLFETTSAQLATRSVIDGKGGTDTLRLASDTIGVLATSFARVSSVEVLDVSMATQTVEVQVDARAVGQADGDRLTIFGGARDIALSTAGLGKAGTVVMQTFGTVSLRQNVDNVVTVSDAVTGKVVGSNGRDTITGGARADLLAGGDGDDLIVGGGGSDRLDGGAGDDVLSGGIGRDTLLGGLGDDTLRIEGGDVATGGSGSDTFVVLGSATITDFAVADRMEKLDLRGIATAKSLAALKITQTADGAKIVVGGATILLQGVTASKLTADNFVFAGQKVSTVAELHGRAPTAVLTGGADRIVGTAGNDIFETTGASFTSADSVKGGAGIDTLTVTSGTFSRTDGTLAKLSSVEIIDVTRASGTATFQVGAAGVGQADGDRLTIFGGMKDIALDTGSVGRAGKVVVETFGTVSLRQGVNNVVTVSDAVSGKVVGSTGRDTITGGARADTLSGGAGNDVIGGGAGSDRIDGGAGDDILSGGTGRDTLLGGLGNDILRLEGGDVATGGAGSDTFVVLGNATITDFAVADRMEKLDLRGIASAKNLAALKITQGTDGAKVAVGGATVVLKGVSASKLTADNFVFVGQTAPTMAELHSKVAAGLLTGGADRLVGTRGNDVFEGSAASFTSADSIKGGTGTDTLSITSGTFSRTDGTLAKLSSVEVIDVSKTDGTPVFQVGAAGVGQADGDRLTLLGGTKNMMVDTGSVGKAGTVVVETFGTVSLRQGVNNAVTVSNAVDGKVVGSNGNDKIVGGARADTLTGGTGHDVLIGNGGADRLSGDAGNDKLTGGAGADTFVFASGFGSSNVDHITDFAAVDTIQLAKSVFTALAPGHLAAAAFKDLGVAGAKLDASDRIVYDHDTGVLAYDADGSGKAAAVTFAVLDNKALLTHADFLIV
ncbi:hypothetical protein [Methylorubrum sp. SB2]|uniref:beta strand repeat-containing protein n=1 Tax=Methylorubrum subtropicum TaxID=3138812 RepID=UPI00313CB261